MANILYKGKSVAEGILPQTIDVPYVADGNYRGIFYQIGTKLETESYNNPALDLNAYNVSFGFGPLIVVNLVPHCLLTRPASFTNARNAYHTANGESVLTITLPSGFRLKPYGLAFQSRQDGGTTTHVSQFTLRGCSRSSLVSGNTALLGTFNTGFTNGSGGQWFVNNSISTSEYYDTFIFTRTADTSGGGVYITGAFFELFGELKVYE